MRKRVTWIDIAKLIGISFVYLGHLGMVIGPIFDVASCCAIQLFFFISGCMSYYDKEPDILKYAAKKFKTIMLPFYGFALFSIFLDVLINSLSYRDIIGELVLVIKGCVRNSFFSGGLWFLSCLFVMEIVFKLLRQLKYRIPMLLVSLALFIVADYFITPRPLLEPHMAYNVDSMMYYLIFYAMGFCMYPFIVKLLELETKLSKVLFWIIFAISASYTGILFEGTQLLRLLPSNALTSGFVSIVQPVILIMFILCLSKLLSGFEFLAKAGRETLYLCTNEWIVKTILPIMLGVFGINISIEKPMDAFVYVIILIVLCVKIIIPFEKKSIEIVRGFECENEKPN